MASKKEIFESAIALCKEHKASETLVNALTGLLKPKAAGQSVNLAEVTKKVGDKVTEIMCQVSGKFLPATVAFFYEDKAGKGITGTDGKSLRRLSRQAESIRKEHIRVNKASKDAIVADMLAGKLDNKVANGKIEALAAQKPNFSTVSPVLPKVEAPVSAA